MTEHVRRIYGRWKLLAAVPAALFAVAMALIPAGGAAIGLVLLPCGLPYSLFAIQAKRSSITYEPGNEFVIAVAPTWWWRPVEATTVHAGHYRIDAKLGAFVGVPTEHLRFQADGSDTMLIASNLLFRRRDWKPFVSALEASARDSRG